MKSKLELIAEIIKEWRESDGEHLTAEDYLAQIEELLIRTL
jgi:hypothetical protein